MLGWDISVAKQTDEGTSPATFQSVQGMRLAAWEGDSRWLGWMRELIKTGKVTDLGGNGYPYRFTATFENFMPQIIDGPPYAKSAWPVRAGGEVPAEWGGKTVIDHAAVAACRPDEWLIVVAWDQS